MLTKKGSKRKGKKEVERNRPIVVPVECIMNFSPVPWIRRCTSAICCEKEGLWEPIWRGYMKSD